MINVMVELTDEEYKKMTHCLSDSQYTEYGRKLLSHMLKNGILIPNGSMNKLKETMALIEAYTKISKTNMNNNPILLDIAKSLAMIADTLYKRELRGAERNER
jgi:hypothetical protein